MSVERPISSRAIAAWPAMVLDSSAIPLRTTSSISVASTPTTSRKNENAYSAETEMRKTPETSPTSPMTEVISWASSPPEVRDGLPVRSTCDLVSF